MNRPPRRSVSESSVHHAEALAGVAVSWIQGGVVQTMNDPETFDTDAYLAAVRGMVAQLGGDASG